MTTMSKERATHLHIPGYLETYEQDIDGWTVSMERTLTDLDLTPFYRGGEGDLCQAHHVGYVIKGKFGIRAADGTEEVYSVGDAFVIAPGHTPVQYAGGQYVAFTPTAEARAQAAVIMPNIVRYAQEHGIELPAELRPS